MDIQAIEALSQNPDELQEQIRKLCYFAAQGSQDYVSELIEHLVKYSLADLPPGSHSPEEIFNQISGNVNLRLDFDQVLSALRRLDQQKEIYSVSENNTPTRFGLKVDDISRFKQEQRNIKDFEQKVINDWVDDIKQRNPGISDADINALIEDLKHFSTRLYSTHSIESVSLYYGEDENIRNLIERLDQEGLKKVLPDRDPVLHTIRMFELPRFFRDAPIDRKKYISMQLTPFFLLHMLQLDPTCARLATQHIRGGTLFLDTNFLYRLFGIQGVELQMASVKLLELSRGLGYNCVVSPRTVEEYRRSIEQFKGRAGLLPSIDPVIADAALLASLEEDTNTQYWRQVKDKNGNFTVNNYYDIYRQVDLFLGQYNIDIDNRFDDFIRSEQALLAQEESNLRKCLPGWQPKSDRIVSHDAHHRLLILALREGKESESPLETPFWFLTCDTKLVTYDRRARARKNLNIPYCVLTSHWTQLLSPFSGAIEGFDIIQAEHFDSPLFRLFPSPDPDIIQDIISRMTVSEGVPPTAIARMITNQAFLRAFSNAKNDEQREEIIQGIYAQYIDELERENKDVKSSINQLDTKLKDREAEIKAIQDDRNRINQELQMVSSETVILRETVSKTLQQTSEFEASKSQMEQQVNVILSELQSANQKSAEDSLKYQQELDKIRLEAQKERERNQQLIDQLTKNQIHQQSQNTRRLKTIYIIITWTICLILLFLLKPWELNGNLPWLTLTLVVISSVVTQAIMIFQQNTSNYLKIALLAVDVILLSVSILLPLGISASETWSNIGISAGIISMILTAFPLITFTTVQKICSAHKQQEHMCD